MKTEILKQKCSKDCINYVILAVIIIIISLFKLGSSPIKNDIPAIDSSVFQIMGRGLLNNQIIYKDLFDHKGPIVYIINALAYIINPNVGLYIMETIILYIGLIFIYKNSRLFLNERLSMITSLVYLIPVFSYLDSGNYTEEYALTFTNIALYNILKIFKNNKYNKKSNWVIIGATFAVNLMIKPTYIAVWIAFGIVQLFCSIKEKKIKELLKYILYMLGGILIILIPIFLYLIINNDIKDFIDAYFLMNMKYSKTSMYEKITTFIKLAKYYKCFIYIIGMLIGNLILIFGKNISKRIKSFVTIFNIMLLILAAWAANLYQHYLIQTAPGIATCLIFLLYIIKNKIENKDKIQNIIKQLPIKFIYVCAIIVLLLLDISYNTVINFDYFKLKYNYNELKRNSILEINNYMDEDDELFVLGNDESCYIILNKQPKYKYFFQTPIFLYDKQILEDAVKYIYYAKPKVVFKSTTNNKMLFEKICKNADEILNNEYEEHDKGIFKYYVLKENK